MLSLTLHHLTTCFTQIATRCLLLLALVTLSACDSDRSGPQLTGMTMGTSYSVEWHNATGATNLSSSELGALEQTITTRLERINALMSTYITDSQLSRFNQAHDTDWFSVDRELANLVARAITLCQSSKGAFDITVGPLVNLWGFGADSVNFHFPEDIEIDIALRSIGCQHLQARLSPPAIKKRLPDLAIDLSAIAKGYAVDELAAILDTHELTNYMVEIGGEVKAKGIASHGHAWRIGVETPNTQRGSIQEVISLDNIAVATSGDYRNYFEHEGQRYAHTIDPRSGYPLQHQLASVTILHPSTAEADAWATAFMVLGAHASLQIAEKYKLSGLLITRHDDQYRTTYFGHMHHYLTK